MVLTITRKKNDKDEWLQVIIYITYLDVGQADSILIQNKGHNMLIDAGNNEDGPLLVQYFKEQNITKFDYLITTHPHEDHIGGMDDIINNFDIEKIYMPDVTTTTKTLLCRNAYCTKRGTTAPKLLPRRNLCRQ